MAQQITTAEQGTMIIPAAYPVINVQSTPVGIAVDGNIVIIGEADGGADFTAQPLKNVYFTPDQADLVQQLYISGPIVDAFRAYAAPSNDPDIVGSANRIYIAKTNTSNAADALVDTDYGTLRDSNFGVRGNSYRYQTTSISAEVAPKLTSDVIAAFGAPLNGLSFSVRLNGSAATVVTLSGTASDHNSAATLAVELNAQLPAGLVASAGSLSGTIVLTVTADAAAYRKHWGKSFELIDSTPGDLAALELSPGLYVSSVEPAVEVQISNSLTGINQTEDVSADIAMSIGYLGTTALLTINQTAKTFATTVTGGAGVSFTADLSQYRTLSDLVSFINSQTGYSASVNPASQQLSPAGLDSQTALPFASGEAGVQPGRLKRALFNFVNAMGSSVLLFSNTALGGLPAPMANAAFLSGGVRGPTLAVDIADAIDVCGGININMMVPLFSRDASLDIADGLTDSGSTYTIDAIHALVKNHCIEYSTPKLARNRICILSFWDNTQNTYANAKAAAQGLASYRCSLTCQCPTQVNSEGVITTFMPWYNAVVAAGMQAGGFYKSICNKLANVISFADPIGYDSGSPGDVEDALLAGLLVMENSTAGNAWVSDQTTYGFDTNFVYNSIQAVYASDLISLDMGASFKAAFVGKSLADISASTGLSYLAQKMAGYMRIKLIATSDDAPAGYKNASVQILAPVMYVNVEIKLATAIYFVPISINISQIQQSAG